MRPGRYLAVALLLLALMSCGSNSPDAPSGLTCGASPASGDAPLVVNFTADAQGAQSQDFRWIFSDGAAATGPTVSRTFNSGGAFTGSVTLSSSAGRQTCTTAAVNVSGSVRLNCFADPEQVVVPGEVRFRAEPAGGNGTFSYLWDFGDGATSAEKDPTHAYRDPITYVARVTASSAGSSATCSKTIQGLRSGVKVSCSADPTSGHAPLAVNFSASASGGSGSYDYLWQFGDGGTSKQASPSHTYANEGFYTALVTVQSGPTSGSCQQGISVGNVITCGDGLVQGGEKCDDKNTTSGDGCSATCTIEPGFTCSGQPSTCTATCGDGLVVGSEKCDDANTANGDGCSSSCTVEAGYTCAGAPSACSPICGDGLVLPGEACDDGNKSSNDGCSSTCAVEHGYTCAGTPSVCTTTCGDGLVAASEGCDDGNTTNGDGCDSTCAVEPGFTCTGEPSVCV